MLKIIVKNLGDEPIQVVGRTAGVVGEIKDIPPKGGTEYEADEFYVGVDAVVAATPDVVDEPPAAPSGDGQETPLGGHIAPNPTLETETTTQQE